MLLLNKSENVIKKVQVYSEKGVTFESIWLFAAASINQNYYLVAIINLKGNMKERTKKIV